MPPDDTPRPATATSADDDRRWASTHREVGRGPGHRAGGARRTVIESLADQECCRSAQEIFDQLRGDGRRVGIASVYRVLDLLVSLDLFIARPGRRSPATTRLPR